MTALAFDARRRGKLACGGVALESRANCRDGVTVSPLPFRDDRRRAEEARHPINSAIEVPRSSSGRKETKDDLLPDCHPNEESAFERLLSSVTSHALLEFEKRAESR